MKNIVIIIVAGSLWLGCKKPVFEKDPRFEHSLITAEQHINAIRFAQGWWINGTVDILDSSFHFKFPAIYRWNDTVVVRTVIDYDSVQTRTLITDSAYFANTLDKDLRFAYLLIIGEEKNRSWWRERLSFQTEITVRKKDGQDTVLKYSHPWTKSLFD